MRKEFILLAVSTLGALSLYAQEEQGILLQNDQEVNSQTTKKSTDWSEQPIGYFSGGIGVGHVPSSEGGESVTGLDWRLGMSRYYNRWGWGVLVQRFRAKQSAHITDGYNYAKMEDVSRLLYMAPQFTGRWVLGEKLTLHGSIGWGWLHYKETVKVSGISIDGTANTLGGNFNIGLDYRLSQTVGLTADVGVVGGEFSSLDVDNQEVQAEIDKVSGKMDASRMYATVGVHVYLWKKKRP